MRKFTFDDDLDSGVEPAEATGYLVIGLSILLFGLFLG